MQACIDANDLEALKARVAELEFVNATATHGRELFPGLALGRRHGGVAARPSAKAGPVMSVSFSSAPPAQEASTLDFCVPDMVIGTRSAYIVGLEAAAFEEVDAEARRGVLLVQGMNDEVH